MRTSHIKLWQTFLGLLVVSSLACGGGDSNKGGCGDGSCTDGGAAGLDGAAATPDLPSATVDQAVPTIDAQSIDQLALGVDLASATTDGGTDEDTAGDVAADRPSDLPWGPEVQKRDTPPKADHPADLPQRRDVPADQATRRDARDVAPDAAPDTEIEADAAPELDAEPMLDTGALDTTALDTGNADTDPTLPVVVPDKLVYGPGEALTARWANGSTADQGAWIGIFMVGAADSAYRDWDWTGNLASGTKVLNVPSTPGTYELRMFANGTSPYVLLATSLPFAVVAE